MKTKKTAKGYQFDWYQEGKRCRRVFRASTKRLAIELYEAYLRKTQLGIDTHPTIREAVVDYLLIKTPAKRTSSQFIDRRALALFSDVCGADHKIEQVTEKVIALLIRHCREDLSWQVSTMNRFLNTVRSFLNWCLENKWLSQPIKIKALRGYTRESRPLAVDELRLMWSHSDEALKLQILMAMTWGLRRAEVGHLAWNAIDFESGRVQIGGINGFQTKSGHSRIVYLTETVSDHLLKWRARQIQASNWVFPSKKLGRPTLASNISKQWGKARRRAGLKDVKFHDLRATAATHFAENGHGDASIASLLGHRTVAMARKYSNQVNEDHRRKAFEMNDQRLTKGIAESVFSDDSSATELSHFGHDTVIFQGLKSLPTA